MAAKCIITTSWDDGHPLDFRLAEMLATRNLRATFYIPRDADTGTMSADKVHQLSRQFEIGAHTLDHVFLDRTPDDQANTQIRDSKKWVEDVTGKPCTMFCPPAGKFSRKHLQMIEQAGYAGVRSVEFFSFDPPRPMGSLMMMPTTLQANPNGIFSYTRNLARRLAMRNLWLYIRHGRSTDWAKLSKSLLEFFQQTGGVFHLWGHSWELEQHAQWERLAEVLDLLQWCATDQATMTNGEICTSVAR